jgi:hypothetical protein
MGHALRRPELDELDARMTCDQSQSVGNRRFASAIGTITGPRRRCPLFDADRRRLAKRRIAAFDPRRTLIHCVADMGAERLSYRAYTHATGHAASLAGTRENRECSRQLGSIGGTPV